MPLTTEFSPDGKGLLFVGTGHLAGVELIQSKVGLLKDEARIRGVTFGKVDLTDVTGFKMSTDEMHRLVELDKRIAAIIPDAVVLVIAPRDHDFGLARMWEILAEETGWRMAVLRNRAEGERWLESMLSVGHQIIRGLRMTGRFHDSEDVASNG